MVAVRNGPITKRWCSAAADCALRPSTSIHRARPLRQEGVHVDLIKLYGSMELAPLVGMADAIVDVVSSGATPKPTISKP